MKIKRSTLRRVIAEELRLSSMTGLKLTPQRLKDALYLRGHLTEEAISLEETELGDSLDSQVDRYLSTYADSSKTTEESWRANVRKFLSEAEGDEEEEGGDEGEEEPAPEASEEPQKLGLHDINVEVFANDVANLIENYDSLLEVKNTLIRRAKNFLSKTYSDDVVNMFEDAMREQHGMIVGKSKNELEADEFQAPKAGEAGPSGGA